MENKQKNEDINFFKDINLTGYYLNYSRKLLQRSSWRRR